MWDDKWDTATRCCSTPPVSWLFAAVGSGHPFRWRDSGAVAVAPVATGGFPFVRAGGTMKEAPISKGRNTLSSQTELHEIIQAKKDLDPAEQAQFELAYFRQRKDPTAALLLSLFLGVLGVDRFYVGDIGLGVAKLLTGGGFFIWVIIDWFLIRNATAAKNTAAIREVRASIFAVRAP